MKNTHDIRSFFGGGALSKKKSSNNIVTTTVTESNITETISENNNGTSLAVESAFQSSTKMELSQNATAETSTKIEVPGADPDRKIPKDVAAVITWESGSSVPYSAVADLFEQLSATSSRLEKEALLARLYRAVILTTPQDLEHIVYLTSNNVFPAYEGLELGIGDALLIKAIVAATGRTKDAVTASYKTEGDLGVVASQSRMSQSTLGFAAKPKALSASYVLEQLRLITRTTGNKSIDKKVGIIKAMLVACQGNEAKFLVRALQGKLRIGTAAQTVLVALANAFVLTPTVVNESNEDVIPQPKDRDISPETIENLSFEELMELVQTKAPPEVYRMQKNLSEDALTECAVMVVKRAFSECPNYTLLTRALLTHPLMSIYQHCKLTPGVPVAPMLAKPTKEVAEVLRRLSNQLFTMEYKYDGERAQVHLCEDGTVKIFSRNSEDNSMKYPDLMDIIRNCKTDGVRSCVVDAEVVAYDREKQCLLPFQVLSTRKRKVEEGEEDSQKVKIILQLFDLLYINGQSLLQESFLLRRSILHKAFTHNEGLLKFASGCDHQEDGDTTSIELFMQEACNAQCEGLMVKTLIDNATYEPSKRSLNWLKLKKDYIEGMGVCDSVDLVVLGGYHGRGKRTNVYGAYLMGCYDNEIDEFQSVCKVGTGFKDEELQRFTENMKEYIVESGRKPTNYNVGEMLTPDDWFVPKVVWECQAADLSKSKVHKGGIGRVEATRGIGLRFPRFLRERDDKKPENATSAEQIVDMYLSQGDMSSTAAEAASSDDDLL